MYDQTLRFPLTLQPIEQSSVQYRDLDVDGGKNDWQLIDFRQLGDGDLIDGALDVVTLNLPISPSRSVVSACAWSTICAMPSMPTSHFLHPISFSRIPSLSITVGVFTEFGEGRLPRRNAVRSKTSFPISRFPGSARAARFPSPFYAAMPRSSSTRDTACATLGCLPRSPFH